MITSSVYRPGLAVAWGILWLAASTACAQSSSSASSEGLVTESNAGGIAPSDGLIASPEPGWPQWRGPYRDGISRERGLLTEWPESGPRLLWKITGIGTGWSSPIVVGERIFITGDVDRDLHIMALDLDGKTLWRGKNGRSWTGSFPGARACCVFSENRIYHMNAHGRVVCLSAATGRESWALDMLDQFDAKNITWAVSECLLVDGPRLIVTPGGRKALMAAVDKTNGRTVWTTPCLGEDRTSHASPILFHHAGRRLISNCSSAHGFGVDADSGKLLWTIPLKNQYGTNVSTPIYDSGRLFYVTPYAELGRAYQLSASGSGVDASEAWRTPLDSVTGGGVLKDGTLYAAGYRKPKSWFAVDWETGQVKYELQDFTTGEAIYADGHLYCLDERGNVGLLKPTENGLKIVGRFSIVSGRIRDAWAHPVLLNGRLYVRYHDTLWCYDVTN